jgi:hypothetical protein
MHQMDSYEYAGLNPETVIIDAAQTQLITILKQHGIDSIPLT